MVCCMNINAEDTYKILCKKGATIKKFAPFRCCGQPQSHNTIGVDDVVKAIELARNRRWYDHNTFNIKEYTRLSNLFDGDMNWVIPGSILATSSPSVCEAEGQDPRLFIPYLKEN
jgi:cell division cycle 14